MPNQAIQSNRSVVVVVGSGSRFSELRFERNGQPQLISNGVIRYRFEWCDELQNTVAVVSLCYARTMKGTTFLFLCSTIFTSSAWLCA